MLALGRGDALGLEGLQRADQLRARLVRDDHVVDVAALGGRVRVREARLVVGDQLLAPLVRRRRGLEVAAEELESAGFAVTCVDMPGEALGKAANLHPLLMKAEASANHMQTILGMFLNHTQNNRAKWFKNGKWTFPETVLADAIKAQKQDMKWLKDAWGREMKIMKRDKKWEPNPWGRDEFLYHEFASAGPDGKFGTDDDVKLSEHINWNGAGWWHDGTFAFVRTGGRSPMVRVEAGRPGP